MVTGHELILGIIAVIQPSGSRLNFHPHIHVLATEGGISREGTFRKVSRFHETQFINSSPGRLLFFFLKGS
ncbi:MAG: transposase [Candidatus Aminicenantaceae bacterium]